MKTDIQKTIQLKKPKKKIIIRELLYFIALSIIVFISLFIININQEKITDIEKYRTEDLRKIIEINEQLESSSYQMDKELKTLLDEAREKGASKEQLRYIYDRYKENNKSTTSNELSSKSEQELEKLHTSRKQLLDVIKEYEKTNLNIEYIVFIAVGIFVIRYLFYLTKWIIKNQLFNRIKLSYVLELMIPIFFTLLFSLFIKSKDYIKHQSSIRTESSIKYADELFWIFSLSFFLITIAEWVRRHKTNKSEYFILKYLYIGLMLLVFILGLWFVKEFQNLSSSFN